MLHDTLCTPAAALLCIFYVPNNNCQTSNKCPFLLQTNVPLYFQRTIDLINNRDAETALDYSAKHLTPLIRDHSDPSLEKRLEEALLLLVLPSSDDLVSMGSYSYKLVVLS